MKTAIIGSGAIGGYFGAKMAQAGFDVTFLARGKQFLAMKQNGLVIKSILGDFHLEKVNVKEKIHEMECADLILVCVKAWQIKEIRDELHSIMHKNTIVLPLQNGVLAAKELGETISKETILGGLCRIISKIQAPGVINHFGITPTIVFGEFNKKETERVKQLKMIFDKAGFASKISLDIESEIWKKFISICVSGLLAVTKTTYGELRELPETRQMMIDLLKEVYTLSQKIEIKIENDFIDKTVSFIDTFPYDSTSSLTRDVWEGKPSEIEYQNGTVVKLGKQYDIDTPVNRFVYNSILPMELKARKSH